jgi:cytochrome oxidase Cu insertion factor (SCO1/SenC/PrrC family)
MDAHAAGASRIDCASGGERMDRKRSAIVAAAVIAIFGTANRAISAKGSAAAQENEKINHTNLKAGDMAPDFTLLDNNWKKIHLADYRGKKNVVLAFYVLAFTGG